MLHKRLISWTIVALMFVTGSVVSKTFGQSLNLICGTTFASDKQIFNDKSLSRMPNAFFRIGLGYTSKDNISLSLDYVTHLNQINLTSTIPIWNMKRRYNGFVNKK